MPLYDVIVLGLGGGGSGAAAAHLAHRGRGVVGFDRFPAAHDQGSSHGRSRIIREAYWEHPSYVPLVWRAYDLWEEPVLAWSAAPHAVEVQTPRGHYEAGALVITAGPWAPQVLEEVGLPLAVERQVVGWFRPVDLQAAFDPGPRPGPVRA